MYSRCFRSLSAEGRPVRIGAKSSYPTIAQRKRNSFDSLRLLFAILVIFSHSFPLTLGDNTREPLARIAAKAMVPLDEVTLGAVAVWAFFIISGFLITKSWQHSSSPWSYLKKRFKRIYPGFLVALSVCALIQALCANVEVPRPPGLWNFLSHAARLQIFDSAPIFSSNPAPNILNGSLWSIPYEFWCYLGVLLLGLSGLLKSRYWLLTLFLLAVCSHAWIDYRHWLPGGMLFGKIFGYPLFWTRVLPFFLAGMYLAVNEDRVELRPSYAVACGVMLIIATPFAYLPYLVYPIFGSYLLLYLVLSPALLPLNLGRWGDFSYGTYLYAFPIQQLLVHNFHGHITPIKLFLLATPLSVAAGALSWILVEQPFLSRGSVRRYEQPRGVGRRGSEPTPGLDQIRLVPQGTIHE